MHTRQCKYGFLRPPRLSQLVGNAVANGEVRGINSLSMAATLAEGATSVVVSSSWHFYNVADSTSFFSTADRLKII